jgi:HprK-related kinase A
LILRNHTSQEIWRALRSGLLCLDVGPFRIRVASDVPFLADALHTLYANHPCSLSGGAYDFDIGVVRPNWFRRFFRSNIVFEISGDRPFLPVAVDHAHALLEWGFNWCIGAYAHQFLILHSAVMETAGKGVLLAAVSGSGKSTLAAEMTLAGWRLLSDELALVDAKGQLHPCPRPISLKNESIEVIRGRYPEAVFGPPACDTHKGTIAHLPASDAAVARANETVSPRIIVFPRWREGAALRVEAVGQGHAALRLIDQSFNYPILGGVGFARMADLVSATEAWELEYSSLDEARDALFDLAAQYE